MKTNQNNLSRNLAGLTLWFVLGLLLGGGEKWLFYLLSGLGIFFCFSKKINGIWLLPRIFALMLGFVFIWGAMLPQQAWNGFWSENIEVRGEIIQYQQGKSYCLLETVEINGQVLRLKPRLTVYLPKDASAEYTRGQKLELKGKLEKPEEARNPGGFDAADYWRSQGVFALLESNQAIILAEPQGLAKISGAMQQYLSSRLGAYLPQDKVDLLWAMLFGEKELLDDTFYENTQKLGIAHIFAVSGLHVGFLLSALLLTLRLLRIEKNPLALLIVAVIIAFYCFMVGLTPSALRATLMGLLTLAAEYLLKRRDSYTVLAASALVVLMVQPFALWSAGFQLSYGVTFGILYLYPLTLKWCSFLKYTWLRNTCAVALAAQLSSIPLTAQFFYYFSAYGLMLNIVLVPLMSLIVPCLLIALLFSVFLPPLAGACFGLTGLFLDILTTSIHLVTYFLGTGQYYLGKPTGLVLLIYLLYLVSYRHSWWSSWQMGKGSQMLALFFLVFLWLPKPPAVTELTYLDVGQGSSAVLRSSEGEVYIFDCGVKQEEVAKYLAYCGVNKVHGIILSHGDSDHIGGLSEVIENFSVQGVYLEEHQLAREELALENVNVIPLQQKLKIALKQGEIFLIPFSEAEITNNGCQLTAVVNYGEWTVVFPGDVDLAEAEKLRKIVPQVDIWTVPHHGSRYGGSEEFYQRLKPTIAVISAGKNNYYGHPHQEIIKALEKSQTKVYRTDENGTITFSLP